MFFQCRPWNGNALSAGATIDAEHQAQARQVAAAQEAYDLSYARYTGGIDSFLNVLDAQRMLYGAQQRLVEIEKRRLANLINLYNALGGRALRHLWRVSSELCYASEVQEHPEIPE